MKPSLPDFPAGSALEFLRRVWRLNHALERLSSRMDKRIGVTAQQRLVIRCIGGRPGMSAGLLATVLHVDPGTVSATLRRLEEKRLITRRTDASDRRRVTLELTRRGRALDAPRSGTAEAAVQDVLTSHSGREVATALKLLDALALRLDAKSPPPARRTRAR